ncbi:Na+/H+ antiporter subunit E [Microcella alkaliphila]|uniref:Putative monovalent cation/H+ antiporter subunit E n=1 Tax=Microcella alkaliphila TaxID=279828 RepID=A0A0U5CFH5_9MICO|nr:Na+/H+ antiporter subunit E [Microcella alkaliphila]BAU32210.1 putative monovalent cation/H+ antiporter subunit E [Microcella alkaliphila]
MNSPWAWPLRILIFLGWFLGELVVASVRVLAVMLFPTKAATPGIVKVHLYDLTETEETLLVILVALTPDTIMMAINRDRGDVYVYGMFVNADAEAFRSSIVDLERRMLRATRSRPRADGGKDAPA